jgi:hypothetical protein
VGSGAFALYVDLQAGSGGGGGGGGGGGAPVNRIIPLPSLAEQGGIDFDRRRLTLYYDDNLIPNAQPSLTVTGRFLCVGGGAAAINVPINAGQRAVVNIPQDACAASLHVDPPPAGPPLQVRGPLSALVGYSD